MKVGAPPNQMLETLIRNTQMIQQAADRIAQQSKPIEPPKQPELAKEGKLGTKINVFV